MAIEKAIRRRCGRWPAGSCSGAAAAKDKPWEEAAFSATVVEPGGEGEPRLVPRRLVGPADHGLEGRGRGCLLRPRRRSPTAGRSPGATLFVPFHARAGRIEDHRRCGWHGTSGQTNLRVGKDLAGIKPTRASRRTTGPGMPGGSPTSTASPSTGATITTTCDSKTSRFSDCFYDSTPAAGGHRSGGRQPDDPEVAHRAAPGRRAALGLGGLQRQRGLLSRLLHARLELRPGHPAPLPEPGTDAARDGVRPVAGRARATSNSAARCRSARSRTTSTPRPTASSAGS